MQLIEEIVDYCYNNEMLDETQLSRLQEMGIGIGDDYDDCDWDPLKVRESWYDMLEDIEADNMLWAAMRKSECRYWAWKKRKLWSEKWAY